MGERRSLTDGLKATPDLVAPDVFKKFVHGEIAETPPQATSPKPSDEHRHAGNNISRSPFTTRIKTEYCEALKRASLERQLNGTFPNSQQEILEEALEPWLRSKGYLK